ncbi:MAG: hypothetical protein ROZ09_13325 [Thiobacillus sp.]|jgi:hypothetical protein|uniref:hypothetical protein n=1 Tax=Thiobacillus sp. TaxID=924 RepID=UPI0028946510|nr:hypothetical protein [Thiobacillus sp.]MDT3707798.1 hypothetical protein [Thiobacillus sp.]
MPAHIKFPSAQSAIRRRQNGALGIFQLLGLGLILLFVVFVLIIVARSLFGA